MRGHVELKVAVASEDGTDTYNLNAALPLKNCGNQRFVAVEFGKAMALLEKRVRGGLVSEFGGEEKTEAETLRERVEVLEKENTDLHLRIKSRDDSLQDLGDSLSEARSELAVLPPSKVAGGATALEWYQRLGRSFGVQPGGFNVSLEEAITAIEHLRDRSTTLREIQKIIESNPPSSELMINGRPL